jgi:mannosyltransferase
MPSVVLDCLIFDLQRSGGVSRYWYNVVAGLLNAGCDLTFDLLLNPDTANAWGKRLLKANALAQSKVNQHPTRVNSISRYFAPSMPRSVSGPSVFHSSYYRVQRRASANVVTVHDFIYERTMRGARAWVHRMQKARTVSNGAHIICVSNSTRNDLFQYHPTVDPDRVHVVHHGVDEVFRSRDEPYLAATNNVLFVGERAGYKNFNAVAHALGQIPGLRLTIVGKPLSSSEKRLLSSVLPGRYASYCNVADEQLAEKYREAVALVYPSTWEGFGLPVLEALACGCPVIATKRSSIPEVAGDAAFLLDDLSPTDIADALRHVRQPTLRTSLQVAGYRQSRRFSWQKSVEQHVAVYERALSEAGHA